MKGRRAIELISTEELYNLLHQSEDVILIDLRPSREMKPITIPMANMLRVAPSELRDLLFWLPPASSVVLYGSLDLCLSVTQAVPQLPGIAPVYMLRELDTLVDRPGSSTVANEP
jgi:xanthine dehydrogenase iron-sulfur cluster and FAD-binding subunit A